VFSKNLVKTMRAEALRWLASFNRKLPPVQDALAAFALMAIAPLARRRSKRQ
jgi:hypothetical protein